MTKKLLFFVLFFATIVGAVHAQTQRFRVPITVSDGTNELVLVLGVQSGAADGEDVFDVGAPPSPPDLTVFDARFNNAFKDFYVDVRGNSTAEKKYTLKYNPAEGHGPIVVSWDPALLASLGTFQIYDSITPNGTLFGPVDMSAAGSITINAATDPNEYLAAGLRIKVTPT